MKKISEINAKNVMVGPGIWTLSAEAVLVDNDTNEMTYVSASVLGDAYSYTAGKNSVTANDGADDDGEYEEQYGAIDDAKASAYYPVFKVLDKLLDSMGYEIA